MMTKHRRIEPVMSRKLGGDRPAHTSAADSSVKPLIVRAQQGVDPVTIDGCEVIDHTYETGSVVPQAAPKAVKAGRFKQRAFERTPYVIPQADLEAAAAHIAHAGDESHASHIGDAPKRKTYLCRGIFMSLFGIWVVGALSVGAFEIAAVFTLLVALSSRIGPDIAGSKFDDSFKPSDSCEDTYSDPAYYYLSSNAYHISRH